MKKFSSFSKTKLFFEGIGIAIGIAMGIAIRIAIGIATGITLYAWRDFGQNWKQTASLRDWNPKAFAVGEKG